MDKLTEILQELGISKVRLAKYLNVSRQMVYNYLEFEDLNKWPKEKKLMLLRLLDIPDSKEETLNSIKITTDYLMAVENRLNQGVKNPNDTEDSIDLKGMGKEQRGLFIEVSNLIKERLLEEENNEENTSAIRYLCHLLQSMDNVPEIKYILGYMSKTTGFIDPDEFAFDEEHQFIFEGILYSALTLYNNGGASKRKLAESRKRFVQEIEMKNEEKLSRTQQLNAVKIQALKELGYDEINEGNAAEVFEKIAEIQSRKV